MNRLKLIFVALVAALASLKLTPDRRYQFANNQVGVRPGGRRTYLANAAITTKNLVVDIGTDANHIALAGTSSIALGVAMDEAEAAEDAVAVQLFGAVEGTVLVVASAAITAGALVVTNTNGKVRTLPGTTGTYYVLGRALTAAGADGDVIEIAPCFPTQRVVA